MHRLDAHESFKGHMLAHILSALRSGNRSVRGPQVLMEVLMGKRCELAVAEAACWRTLSVAGRTHAGPAGARVRPAGVHGGAGADGGADGQAVRAGGGRGREIGARSASPGARTPAQ